MLFSDLMKWFLKAIRPQQAVHRPGFDFPLLEPWHQVEGTGRELVAELKRELRRGHILAGCTVRAWARRFDSDDVLFRVEGRVEGFAVVHLTWLGKRDPNPGWPFTRLYSDLDHWRSECMEEDHRETQGHAAPSAE